MLLSVDRILFGFSLLRLQDRPLSSRNKIDQDLYHSFFVLWSCVKFLRVAILISISDRFSCSFCWRIMFRSFDGTVTAQRNLRL